MEGARLQASRLQTSGILVDLGEGEGKVEDEGELVEAEVMERFQVWKRNREEA